MKNQKKRPRRSRRTALIAAILVLVIVILALIFGGSEKTVHQMPTIERESTSDFAPEAS